MGGGAWPFLVRGVICLLNCDNERDLSLLNSGLYVALKNCWLIFLWGLSLLSKVKWSLGGLAISADISGQYRITS